VARFSKILVRATNWLGDAVMSLPAIRALRRRFPSAEIVVVARPWVADLYRSESAITRVMIYEGGSGARDWAAKWRFACSLRSERFDCAILLQNAFEAALLVRIARIPDRIGYDRDGRGWLLTNAVPVPRRKDIPRHESFYYLELLRRANLADADSLANGPVRLEGAVEASRRGERNFERRGIRLPVIGVSPGAAYGGAKRWIPERFVDAATQVARSEGAFVALFGSASEAPLCETMAAAIQAHGCAADSLAGATTLAEFIDMAAACRAFLTNDSGAMHIASALGVPTVAVFGATDHEATGPTGPLARIVREPVECSPCLLRECPIDHRCMTRVTVAQVAGALRDLLRDRL
jgi:heptosyltransferase-2